MSEVCEGPLGVLAEVEDPRDFSWCARYEHDALGRIHCAAWWDTDPRVMFAVRASAGPRWNGVDTEVRVCFAHYMELRYGLSPMRTKFGRVCYVPPQVEHRDTLRWAILSEVLPIDVARRVENALDRGVRIRSGGWRRAPFARRAARLRLWLIERWWAR